MVLISSNFYLYNKFKQIIGGKDHGLIWKEEREGSTSMCL